LRSPAGRNEIEGLATGNQESMWNIGQERIKRIRIAVPPLAEQEEIVRRVEEHMRLADAVEGRVARAAAQLERLRQALLARAFSGRLVAAESERRAGGRAAGAR